MSRFRRPFSRRRRAGRLRRPRRPKSPAARKALNQLQRAHGLMTTGKPAEAAVLFEELAGASDRRNLRRTPQFYLQAGRAWIAAGQTERGADLLIKALQSMAELGQFQRMPRVSRRVLDNLRSKGLSEIASSFETQATEILGAHGLSIAAKVDTPAASQLPAKCGSCGGNVHPEEVEWSGAHFAACAYCGSSLEISA